MRKLVLTLLAAAAAPVLLARPPAPPPTPTPTTPRVFDPNRPPAQEMETAIGDGFTLAAVGDLIISRPLSQLLPRDAGFASVARIVREADVAFGNFETVAVDPGRIPGAPHPGVGDVSLLSEPAVAGDLAKLGFDMVSRANNHALDWGVESMRETSRILDAAGLVHAGVGENRGEARAARYFESPLGRVGLVSMASTFSEYADALPPRGRAPARPGLSALRVERTVVVTPETLRQLRSVQAALAGPVLRCEVTSAWEAERRQKEREPSDELNLLDIEFRVGERAAYRYEMNPEDVAGILNAIRLGKQHSDLLVATIHAHETGLGCEEPGDFLPVLARAAIDAGAGVFIAHGEHRLMPIEIYKGRPIFYSLANFFWSDILEPLSASTWETNRDLAIRSSADPAKATDADLLAAWNSEAFDDPRVFETVIAVTRWEAGRVADVRLYPVDLGYGERLTRSGTPRLASPPVARRILERLQRISKPYGTSIAIEGDVGIIRLTPAPPAGVAR